MELMERESDGATNHNATSLGRPGKMVKPPTDCRMEHMEEYNTGAEIQPEEVGWSYETVDV